MSSRDAIEKNNFDNKIMLVSGDGKVTKLDLATGLGASKDINGAIDEETRYIYIPGAFTNSVICDISLKNLKQVTIRAERPYEDIHKRHGLGHLQKKRLQAQRTEKH